MSSYVDLDRLAALVKSKRGDRGLRDVAKEIGEISPSTLSRVENGKMTDMGTFLSLCDWLEIAPEELIKNAKNEQPPEISTPEAIALHLCADSKLNPTEAKLLEKMFKAAYDQAVRDIEDDEE